MQLLPVENRTCGGACADAPEHLPLKKARERLSWSPYKNELSCEFVGLEVRRQLVDISEHYARKNI